MRDASHPADHSAHDAVRRIARRQLSPVVLAETCIARIEQLNPAIS